MRLLITSLVVLVLAVLAGGVLMKDTGFVVIGLHGQVVRTSFVFFVVLLLITLVALYVLVRLLWRLWRAPRDLRDWSRRGRQRKAQAALSDGLLALAHGDWHKAEKTLLRGAGRSDRPLLYYLGAAHAAQALQASDRRDQYLQLAKTGGGEAELAVLITQTEIALRHGRLDEAAAVLAQLQTIDAEHDQVLRLQLAYLRAAHNWSGILDALPRLAKRRVITGGQHTALEIEAVRNLLRESRQPAQLGSLRQTWERLPKERRRSPELVSLYARALTAAGQGAEAETIVRAALKKHWDAGLASLYGQIAGDDILRQLKHAEDWIAERGNEPELLLTLGRLSVRNGLWGKARSYLETLVEQSPSPDAYRLLAETMEQLGDRDGALRCHRKGLLLATGAEAAPSLPARVP